MFLLLLLLSGTVQIYAFGIKEPVSVLLQKHVSEISRLKEETYSIVGDSDFNQVPYNNDVFYLRYCLEEKGVEDIKTTLSWRQGEGKKICDAAKSAFQKAKSGGGWINDPIRDAAPSADIINKYLTASTGMTTSSSNDDLLYCIRAGMIDDKALMTSIDSVNDLVMFFIYSKEIISLEANDRSLENDKLSYVITVNDLSGLKLIGGDASFRQALSEASKKANELYPALGGPSLLLNLPKLVSAIVKIFTPLFPEKVREKIKFSQGPLKDVKELFDVAPGGKDRESFLKAIDEIIY